jgi:uncharacterized protein (UPF0276 family)
LAYRWPIDGWIRAHLDQIEVLEVTVDTCISGTEAARAAIFDLVRRVPITAHGVGLSIGTDAPLDLAYLDRVAEVVCRLGAMTYSEHLAFTRVPGRELGNLLPVPRTSATARAIITKVADPVARPGAVSAGKHRLCVRLAGFDAVPCRVPKPYLR